jgi:hypothetical protein
LFPSTESLAAMKNGDIRRGPLKCIENDLRKPAEIGTALREKSIKSSRRDELADTVSEVDLIRVPLSATHEDDRLRHRASLLFPARSYRLLRDRSSPLWSELLRPSDALVRAWTISLVDALHFVLLCHFPSLFCGESRFDTRKR